LDKTEIHMLSAVMTRTTQHSVSGKGSNMGQFSVEKPVAPGKDVDAAVSDIERDMSGEPGKKGPETPPGGESGDSNGEKK
jgi:hypothetical protein